MLLCVNKWIAVDWQSGRVAFGYKISGPGELRGFFVR
ncbi:hypothetical protein GGR91_000393 [Sphingorhabdus rigui]|uniref:Uncharacterized protein n=1 Tax=Sphingorhabdus rigui TaxID=1282858 RepID=A0A840AX33_9SPHN|nr:hypothetical protein [Sphingorhabdus rigui]